MPSKACETLYIRPYPIYYALLGSQGNTITLTSAQRPPDLLFSCEHQLAFLTVLFIARPNKTHKYYVLH